MISSEVARTLVKSPPELWTELSDPAKLASHLSELGEVRITGTEPERMVEWQAETASGTVQLKPSGWGTQVTLTVTAALPAPDPSPGPEAEPSPAPEAPGEPPVLPRAAAEQGSPADPQPTAVARSEVAYQPQAHDQPEAHAQPEAYAHAETYAQIETYARPEAAAKAESESEADEGPGAPVQARTDPPDAVEPGFEAGPEAVAEEAPAPAGPERRRRFFARLFARRRHAAQAAEPVPEEAVAPAQAESERPVAPTPGAADRRNPEPRATERRTFDRSAGAILPAEVEQARHPAAGPARDPSATEVADGPKQDPDGPDADISAELRRAEEVAAERVHAVLTSVLDRLGAAHHRPFSRA
jgi:hypothetical protein